MSEQDNNGKNNAERKGGMPATKCEDIQGLLTDYMARELGDSRSALVREHLRICAHCQAASREIAQAFDMLRAAGKADAGPPERLSEKHRARIKRAYTHPLISWIETHHTLVSIIAAAILVILVLGALLLLTLLNKEEPVRAVPIRWIVPSETKLDEIRKLDAPDDWANLPAPEPAASLPHAVRGWQGGQAGLPEPEQSPMAARLGPDRRVPPKPFGEGASNIEYKTQESVKEGIFRISEESVMPEPPDWPMDKRTGLAVRMKNLRRNRIFGAFVLGAAAVLLALSAFLVRRLRNRCRKDEKGATEEGPPPFE